MFSYFGYFPLWFHEFLPPNILVKIFVKIKRFCTVWSLTISFSREKIFTELMTQSILAWIMKYTKFTPSISTRFLANYSKFSNILTFRLSNTRQYFAGDEKIGKYSISCTEHKVEKRFESHTLEFLPSVQRAFKG